MTRMDCAKVREFLPDLAAERLAADVAAGVSSHVSGCDECRAELDVLRLLRASRPAAPDGLSARIASAVRAPRREIRRPWWGLTAAAVAALALGIGVSSEPTVPLDGSAPAYATEMEQGDLWSSDDGLIAGAPALETLSDEALFQLLEDLDLGSSGGAV